MPYSKQLGVMLDRGGRFGGSVGASPPNPEVSETFPYRDTIFFGRDVMSPFWDIRNIDVLLYIVLKLTRRA